MLKSIHRRKITPSHGNSGRNHRTKLPVRKQQGSRRVTGKIRSKSIKILARSFSEPSILYRSCFGEDDRQHLEDTPKRIDLPVGDPDQIVYLSQIRSEVCASAPSLSGFSSPTNKEVNKREAEKVVISVSVEGSPGPLRTMVKLSSNVEETIKIVVKKYCEEGRTPKLNTDLTFELHQSHFSIQCLEKTEVIGEIGSRSFYMRKKEPNLVVATVISPVRKNLPSSNLFQAFIAQKFGRIVRRTRKIWNILVCVQ